MARNELSAPTLALRGGIIALVTALVVLLVLANAMGRFDEKVHATAVLDTAGGAIKKGAEIKLDGVVVGEVSSIEPDPEGVELGLDFDPEQAEKVPANVTVRVLPISIFGAAYVELVEPRQPQGTVTAGATLEQDRGATSIELGDLLEDTQELVDALGPAELATALETFASTLDGKGESIGKMIETADRAVRQITPYMPLIRQDIRLATTVTTTLARMTPNLFTALDGVLAAGQTMLDFEPEFQDVLTGLSDLGGGVETIVTDNQKALYAGIPLLRRVVHTLYLGRGDIPRTFAAIIKLANGAGPALSYGPFMRIDADLRLPDERAYGPGDCPQYNGLRGKGC